MDNLESRIRGSGYGGIKTEELSWLLRVLRETVKLDPRGRLDSRRVLSSLPTEWWADGHKDDVEQAWDWESLVVYDPSDEEGEEV